MLILLFCFFPLLILIVAHFVWPKEITLPEIAVGAVVSVVLAIGMYNIGKYSAMTFTEYWNGDVVETYSTVRYYDRSYESCDSEGKNCRTIVDTGHDMNWYIDVDFGPDGDPFIQTMHVRYVDCSSTNRNRCVNRYPDTPEFASIRPADPASMPNDYLNYVRAAEFSLFNETEISYDGELPDYPTDMYGHINLDRVILDDVTLPMAQSVESWNRSLHQILAELGPNKQANMILVLTDAQDQTYADALISEWQGANKNDIVIIASFVGGQIDGAPAPAWVRVHSWAKQDIMNVTMRDELLDNPEWWQSNETLFPNIERIVLDHFVRRPMAEFEYLKDEIEPSRGAVIGFSIISILAGLGLAFFFHTVDVFEGLKRNRRFR